MIDALKIGPVNYQVKEEPKLFGVNGDGSTQWLIGQQLAEKALIKLDVDLPHDVKCAGLLHEAAHAILEQAGMVDHPEQAIIALGYGMVALIRDNPELVKFITQQAQQDKATTPGVPHA